MKLASLVRYAMTHHAPTIKGTYVANTTLTRIRLCVRRVTTMANDYVERLRNVLDTFIGCSTSDGQILDIEEFNDALEEFAYIVNKMDLEVW